MLLRGLASLLSAATLAASHAVRTDRVAFAGAPLLGSSSLLPSTITTGKQFSRSALNYDCCQHERDGSSRRRRARQDSIRGHCTGRSPSSRATTETSMSLLRTYEANELQLQRFIGELGFVEITDWEYNRKTSPIDPETPSRTLNSSGTTVRLFEARTYTNARVVLKEFLPKALRLAYRELEINERLLDAWEGRNGATGRPPVLSLMGSLVADESFKSRKFLEGWISKFPSLSVPATGSVWLVYRWEGLYTFASFPTAKQETEFFDVLNPSLKAKRRAAFVKEMVRGAASALAFMHEAGVVHRSLGAPSLRINTLDERYPKQLEVLLSDFGFSSRLSEIDDETIRRASSSGATTPFAVSDFLFREDLYSLGYVFLELVFGAFCDSKPKRPDQNALKRLLEDIFKGDFKAFKEYCLTEPSWEPAVDVLDAQRGAGWGLAASLLGARGTAASAFGSGGGGGGDYDDDGDDYGGGGGSGGWEGGPGEVAGGGGASMVSTRGVLSLPYFADKG
eukprot:jgi/Undpi1/13343/HiC_scaffold_8.g03002.m1